MIVEENGLGLKLPAPAVAPEEVARLVAVLREAGGWITAREIAARLGDGADERSVRAAASAATPAVVSFPGSRGYRLFTACTVGEISHAIEAMEAQGKEMFKRANILRRAYHARYREPAAAEVSAELALR